MRFAALLLLMPAVAFAGPESWKSVQSTGGIVLGAPFHSTDGWLLGVRAKLTRLPPPKGQKDPPEGGLWCERTQAVVEGNNIYLTIISGVARGPIAAVCPSAKLGEIPAGNYKVFYRGPNEPPMPLKDITLAR